MHIQHENQQTSCKMLRRWIHGWNVQNTKKKKDNVTGEQFTQWWC